MNNRIKTVRKHYGLTQSEFATRIGISNPSVSRLETGENSPSEQTLRLILSEFDISEEWLREGIGNMLIDDTALIRENLIGKFNPENDDFKDWLIDCIITMDDNQWALLRKFIHDGAEKCRAEKAAQEQAQASEDKADIDPADLKKDNQLSKMAV